MRTLEDIKAELDRLNQFILDSDAKVCSGEMVTLFQLDDQVAKLCEDSVKLPTEEIEQIQPLLARLINHLEQLSLSIRDYQMKHENKDTP